MRHYGKRRRGFHRVAKPSIGILAGLAAGPYVVAFGAGHWANPIWKWNGPGGKSGELINRVTIAYTGYKTDGAHFSISEGGGWGTIGIVGGFAAHYLANISGINRSLARMKMPFRI